MIMSYDAALAVQLECLKAFQDGQKEEAIRLLPFVVNPHKLKDRKNWTILHWACRNGWIEVVFKLMIDEYEFDPMCKSDAGNTPLHVACHHKGNLSIIQYLINECHCDPMIKNNEGNTPLHEACRNKDMQMVRYLISKCNCDPMATNNEGNTPLHDACRNKDMKMVQYFTGECKCDPMSKNQYGDTPLHTCIACGNRDMQMVRYLISECRCDPMSKNEQGNTPLHLACLYNYPPYIPIIEYILSTGKFDPLAKNKQGKTPLSTDSEDVKKVFAKFGKVKISHVVNSYVNVVLLGNPGVGKSTLAQVIIQRASSVFASVRGLFQHVKGVELCTAGIVPSKLEHRELGNVILHDSAGQPEYYSSHIAVLENLLHGSAAVFIIVVSLVEEEVRTHLHHWLTVIENEGQKALSQCHVIIVASHIDQVDPTHLPDICKDLVEICSSRLCQHNVIVNCGLVPLDCRKLVGGELSIFKTNLSSACQSIRSANTREMSLYCHMLYALLEKYNESVYTLEGLLVLCRESEKYYLPLEVEMISELLSSLHATGLIVFIKNNHMPGNSWVVVRKSVLLTELNGVLFAPDRFRQHRGIASNTGIIKLSTLSKLFPHYSSDMLVLFLQYMELCQEVSQDFLNFTNAMIKNGNSSNELKERLLFFPALIRDTERPQEIKGTFQFGWCLQCSNLQQFFLPRFLHVLLLHLAYQYALPKSTDNQLHRRCAIWMSGIQWRDTLGIQTIVELVDDSRCVLLLMLCQQGSERDMLCLCKELVNEILLLRNQLCPSLKLREFLIDPSKLHYPIEKPSTLTLYDIELVASCIIAKDLFVLDTEGGKQIKIAELFPFENIQTDALALFAGRNLEDIAKNLSRDPALMRKQSRERPSPKNILTRHLSDITDVVLEHEKLAIGLHSAGLITDCMKDRVFTVSSYPSYEKISILVINVWRLLRSGNDSKTLLLKFCDVLKGQNNDRLIGIAEDILKEIR